MWKSLLFNKFYFGYFVAILLVPFTCLTGLYEWLFFAVLSPILGGCRSYSRLLRKLHKWQMNIGEQDRNADEELW